MAVVIETWRHCWLTVNVQAVVTNSFLPHECWVRRLTAQRRSVIFPLHGDTDSVGNTHSLAVLLLRDHTWRKERNISQFALIFYSVRSHFRQILFAYLSYKGLRAHPDYLHLSDSFIQSHLQCIQVITFYCQYVCSLGIEPTTFCTANAMLYHWATGTYFWRAEQYTVHTLISQPQNRLYYPSETIKF